MCRNRWRGGADCHVASLLAMTIIGASATKQQPRSVTTDEQVKYNGTNVTIFVIAKPSSQTGLRQSVPPSPYIRTWFRQMNEDSFLPHFG